MDIPDSTITQIQQALQQAQNITIISHRNPDADTIGSNLALREYLISIGKNVVSACKDAPPKETQFLGANADNFSTTIPQNTDLLISVDCGSTSQATFSTSDFPLLNIDHHPSNNNFGTINLVIPDAASTTLVVFYLFKKLQVTITPTIATALLCGLYYDTGSFMHSNVNTEVYACAAELLAAGANMKAIIKNLYKSRSIEQLKTWGKILDGIKVTPNNVVVSGITQKELERHGATTAETSGIIDYLSTVKNTEFATLLVEDGKGNIRGSFRTRKNNINLSEMAGMFGGGGHKKASGFTIEGELGREVIWKIKHEPE